MNTTTLFKMIIHILLFNSLYLQNATITINWANSSDTCISVIENYFIISNSSGYVDPLLKVNYVCKSDGSLMAISNCVNEPSQQIEVLSYYFSLPENDPAKQCFCQSKCNNIHTSSYTMKFINDGKSKYFTTSNPCVAFCNKGYEIFLTSYAINSFPTITGYGYISKSFDTSCYNRLDDNNKRGRQLALMKIELCKARIICNLLVNQFVKDIETIEKAIYGSVLSDDTILQSDQKYWIKQAVNPNTCIELTDSGTNAYCLNKYQLKDKYFCSEENNLIVDSNKNSTSLRYIEAIHQLFKCVTNAENELTVEASNTGECICKYPEQLYIFSTDIFENVYGNSNEKYVVYGNVNFSFQNQTNDLSYLKEEFHEGFCECKAINLAPDFLYDIFCTNIMYSACIIDNNIATSKVFKDAEQINNLFYDIYRNPVDLVLGYTKEKCENLNNVCNNDDTFSRRCFLKYKNVMEYPVVGIDNDFMRCVENEYKSEYSEDITFYYDCPSNSECNEYSCTNEYISICEDTNFIDTQGICKFSSEQFDCYKTCENNTGKLCIEENNSTVYLLTTKYNSCLRECYMNIDVKCDFNGVDACEITECKDLFCKDPNNANSIYCQSEECESNDYNCICNSDTCKEKDNLNEYYCYLPQNVNAISYKVTEKEKCMDICTQVTNENDYWYCETCLDTKDSCCDAYCVNLDHISMTECVNVNETPKLISEKQKCMYDCTGFYYESLNQENCETDSCVEDCNRYDAIETEHCTFDSDMNKKCITEKELCLLNCESNIQISVNCDNLTDYECLISYCNECYDKKLQNDNIVCQDMCKCTNFNLNSINECNCFTEVCESKSNSVDKYCLQNGIYFQLLSDIETCIKECKNEDFAYIFQCNDCLEVSDCCDHMYEINNQEKCVEYNSTYFYSDSKEICKKALEDIRYNEVEKSNCCLAECNNNNDIICVEEDSIYREYNKSDFCYEKCIENNGDLKIVDDSKCCMSNCLAQSKSKFCVKTNEIYENITKDAFCNFKCNLNNLLELYDDSLCCQNQCYSEQNMYASGTYCNESYEVYNSWIDYCIKKRCNNIQENIYFCSNVEDCTADLCKEQISITKCNNSSGNPSISINQSGVCKIYDNICFANSLKNPNEKLYVCDQQDIDMCLKSSNFFDTYSRVHKNNGNQKFCMNGKIISAIEYDFHKKCLKNTSDNLFECNGLNCNQSFCKKKNCRDKCEATERLYWGYDCNYYQSTCELDCLEIDYFDFFDISKLLNVCKNNPLVNTVYLDLITLKKHVCLRTGKLKIFNTFISWVWKSYTDCVRLNSKNLTDCSEKCIAWAKNF